MSHYKEFCESLKVGKARTEEGQREQLEAYCHLQEAVGQVVQRMCDSFHCPREQVHYVDTRAGTVCGMVHESLPTIWFDPETGRSCVGLEIRIVEPEYEGYYPVWLGLQFVSLSRGGLEFHLGPDSYQLPEEERTFFNRVANVINEELRKGYTRGPRKIGFWRFGSHAEPKMSVVRASPVVGEVTQTLPNRQPEG
jgi:hypothetical protein